MRFLNLILFFSFTYISVTAQGFDVKASGEQTFSFKDKRNQATFYSTTILEDINGLTSDISGEITFNVDDIASLKGEIIIQAASLKTGINNRDEHLKGEGWLYTEKYPEIIFQIKEVNDIETVSGNKLKAKITGDFTLRGITNEEVAEVILTYLDESEETQIRAKGDLLGASGTFSIELSRYGIENKIIGKKVSEKIDIKVNMVGSNHFNLP